MAEAPNKPRRRTNRDPENVVGKTLRSLMAASGTTGYKLAKMIGMRSNHVYRMLSGQHSPSAPVLLECLRALRVKLPTDAGPEDEPIPAGEVQALEIVRAKLGLSMDELAHRIEVTRYQMRLIRHGLVDMPAATFLRLLRLLSREDWADIIEPIDYFRPADPAESD